MLKNYNKKVINFNFFHKKHTNVVKKTQIIITLNAFFSKYSIYPVKLIPH